MAFRRKDVKKASYYVWFLGAKESKGLRGDEFVVPVLRFLLDKEQQFEPSKVTLQVSNKGLKIVQTLNVPRKSGDVVIKSTPLSNNLSSFVSAKTEQIKHLISHHSITWVSQEEDIICCIMLIYNPVTKCPVHVHVYRCDSIETASTLRSQLQVLINRPENQKKFREIEMRLASKGLMPSSLVPSVSSSPSTTPSSGVDYLPKNVGVGNFVTPASARHPASDGRSTRSTEESYDCLAGSSSSDVGSGGGGISDRKCSPVVPIPQHSSSYVYGEEIPVVTKNSSNISGSSLCNNKPKRSHSKKHNHLNESRHSELNGHIAMVYDSLAAELRAKLGNPKTGPILLPPRDYDTISRKRGKLNSVELRKSTNPQIVGPLDPIARYHFGMN